MLSTTRSRLAALAAALGLAALASAPAAAGAKKFFLTVDSFPGNAALDACGKGYHMASIWEIYDVTQLKYDAKRGQVREDTGSGPLATIPGWVRTGGAAYTGADRGIANCSAWTSNLDTDNGTIVSLGGFWDAPAIRSSPWEPALASCNAIVPVWCKQN
jgi:hypothetical protein